MADVIDHANDYIERELDSLLEQHKRTAAKEVIESTGRCLSCGAPLEQSVLDDVPKRWCDHSCLEDWERRRKAKERNRG